MVEVNAGGFWMVRQHQLELSQLVNVGGNIGQRMENTAMQISQVAAYGNLAAVFEGGST